MALPNWEIPARARWLPGGSVKPTRCDADKILRSLCPRLSPAPHDIDPVVVFGSVVSTPAAVPTVTVIATMIDAGQGISDLVFSPGRPPQVERSGDLVGVAIPQLAVLKPEDTARIASDLIGHNQMALRTLRDQGSCDLS